MMNNDPCRGCAVYKEVGCTHVDSYLCDYPSCSMLAEYLENKHPEARQKKQKPRWLEKISSTVPCEHCGVIAGSCLYESLGGKCKREEKNEHDES